MWKSEVFVLTYWLYLLIFRAPREALTDVNKSLQLQLAFPRVPSRDDRCILCREIVQTTFELTKKEEQAVKIDI